MLGMKLIVVDPQDTKTARGADIWLRPRFGTDAALLLGMIRVIIDEDLHFHQIILAVAGKLVVETDAVFFSPEPRSIVMTILEGEGKGSVVETHAAPIDAGRTAIVEATLATSDREGFQHALKLQRFIRPLIERSARRLWVDDVAYAERLYELRQ